MRIPAQAIPWWTPPAVVVVLATFAFLAPEEWSVVPLNTGMMSTLWEVEATLYGLTAAVGVFAVQSFATASSSLRSGALVDYARASGLLLMLEFQTALLVLTSLVAFDVPGFDADGPPGLLAVFLSLSFVVPLPVLLRDMLDELDRDAVEAFERRRLRRDMRLATRKRAPPTGRALRHVEGALDEIKAGGTREDLEQVESAGGRLAALLGAVPATAVPPAISAAIGSIEGAAEAAGKWSQEAAATGVAVLLRASVEHGDDALARRVLKAGMANRSDVTDLFERSWTELASLVRRSGDVHVTAVRTQCALLLAGARSGDPAWVPEKLEWLLPYVRPYDRDAFLLAVYARLRAREDAPAEVLATVTAAVADPSAVFRGRDRLTSGYRVGWADLPGEELDAATVELAVARTAIGGEVRVEANDWLRKNRAVVEDLLETARPQTGDGGGREWQRTALLAAIREEVGKPAAA